MDIHNFKRPYTFTYTVSIFNGSTVLGVMGYILNACSESPKKY
jgi:hypothetical protein